MTAQQKKALRALIAEHVHAQIGMSWSGSQPPQDHAAYEADVREAKAELDAFIDTLSPSPPAVALALLRSQNEVRLLNRALTRKNRKLKGQYEALHGLRFTVDADVNQGTAYRVYRALDDVMTAHRGTPGVGDRLLEAMLKTIKGIPQ